MSSWLPAQVYLDKIRETANDQLQLLLPPIGEAIQRELLRMGEVARAYGSEDDEDESGSDLMFSHTQNIEELLGVTFVIAQNAVTRCIAVAHALERSEGLSPGSSATQLRTFGPLVVRQDGLSQVELVHALGNFFKHRDEWKRTWVEASGSQRLTVDVLERAGLSEFAQDSFQTAATTLGLNPPSGLIVLKDRIVEWARNVSDHYEQRLVKRAPR